MIERVDLIIQIENYENGLFSGFQIASTPQPPLWQPQPVHRGVDDSQREAKAIAEVKIKFDVMHEGNMFEVELFIASMDQFYADLSKAMNIKKKFSLQFKKRNNWIVLQNLDQLSGISSPEIKINLEDLEEVEIGSEIGHGAYSTVYSGTWSGTSVAIKILKNQDFPEVYTREVKKYKALKQHPNVIQFFGVCRSRDNEQGIITEAADGDLSHMLMDGKIEEESFLKICKDVAAGMLYLSANKIVHRDLAARNILLKKEGLKFIAKVADFGLSASSYTILKSKNEVSHLEFAMRWTAPEALLNDNWTEKSDVWSFGMVLFEIFTHGQRPYSNIFDEGAVREKVIGGLTPVSDPCYPATCPEDVKKIMNSCWKKIPQDRGNFKSILKEIEDIIAK